MVNLQGFKFMKARALAIENGNYYRSEHEKEAA